MGHFSLMERGKFIFQSDSNEKWWGAKPRHLFFEVESPDVRAQRGQSLSLRRFKSQHNVLAFVVLCESEPKVQASTQNNKSHCHEVAWLLNLKPPIGSAKLIPNKGSWNNSNHKGLHLIRIYLKHHCRFSRYIKFLLNGYRLTWKNIPRVTGIPNDFLETGWINWCWLLIPVQNHHHLFLVCVSKIHIDIIEGSKM